ncbi:hypothetical protein [Planctomicrobium sp. SH664]
MARHSFSGRTLLIGAVEMTVMPGKVDEVFHRGRAYDRYDRTN